MYMTPATIRKRFFSVLETAEKNIHLYVNTPGSRYDQTQTLSFF